MTSGPDGASSDPTSPTPLVDPADPISGSAPEGEDSGTWQSLLVAQILVTLIALGYGFVTGDWSETWTMIGGCVILAVAAGVLFRIRKTLRNRRRPGR